MKFTSRSTLILLIASIALSLYAKLSRLLGEFNYDVARMLTKTAKHPAAWIDWGWLTGGSVAIFIIWLKQKDEPHSPAGLQWWLILAITVLVSGPCGFLLYLYLQQRNREALTVNS